MIQYLTVRTDFQNHGGPICSVNPQSTLASETTIHVIEEASGCFKSNASLELVYNCAAELLVKLISPLQFSRTAT